MLAGLGSIPPVLDLTGFQDVIFVSYTSANLLKGAEPITGPRLDELGLPGGQLSRDCVVTISTMYFGHRHHDHTIKKLGLQRYGQSLRQLNESLAHPVHSKSLMVLYAVLTMTLFEVSIRAVQQYLRPETHKYVVAGAKQHAGLDQPCSGY